MYALLCSNQHAVQCAYVCTTYEQKLLNRTTPMSYKSKNMPRVKICLNARKQNISRMRTIWKGSIEYTFTRTCTYLEHDNVTRALHRSVQMNKITTVVRWWLLGCRLCFFGVWLWLLGCRLCWFGMWLWLLGCRLCALGVWVCDDWRPRTLPGAFVALRER